MSALAKSILYSIFVIALASTWHSPNAHAKEGGSDGSGGGFYCGQYSEYVTDIITALETIGQKEIDRVNATIRLVDLLPIKENIKCIPVETLDRIARSNSDTYTTQLHWQDWRDEKSDFEKYRLAAHEISVMAEYENIGDDGEYNKTTPAIMYLYDNSGGFRKKMRERTHIDGDKQAFAWIHRNIPDEILNTLHDAEVFIRTDEYPWMMGYWLQLTDPSHTVKEDKYFEITPQNVSPSGRALEEGLYYVGQLKDLRGKVLSMKFANFFLTPTPASKLKNFYVQVEFDFETALTIQLSKEKVKNVVHTVTYIGF